MAAKASGPQCYFHFSYRRGCRYARTIAHGRYSRSAGAANRQAAGRDAFRRHVLFRKIHIRFRGYRRRIYYRSSQGAQGINPALVDPIIIRNLGITVGIVLPLFYLIPIGSFSLWYNITREKHAEIRAALDQRFAERTAAKAKSQAETVSES